MSIQPATLFVADPTRGVARQVREWTRHLTAHLTVQFFGEARHLLRRMEYQRPDLLLLDATLPSFDALTALRTLRLERTALLLVSSNTLTAARLTMEALLAGASGYMIKRGRGSAAHLALNRSRFLQALARVTEQPVIAAQCGEWRRCADDEDRSPGALPVGQRATLVLGSPCGLRRMVSALTEAIACGPGAMLIGMPQAPKFSRALREVLSRRLNRAVLDLRAGEMLHPGQWRLLPGRALLRPGGLGRGCALQANRLVDEQRALTAQLNLLAAPEQFDLRILLCEPPCGEQLDAARRLSRYGHQIFLPADTPEPAGAPLGRLSAGGSR